MQLSDTGVREELTVVGQVTRGVAGQGPRVRVRVRVRVRDRAGNSGH